MSDFVNTPLDEVILLENDKKAQLKSSDYSAIGILPIIDQSSNFICGYTNDTTKKYSKPLPVIVFGDHTLHTKFIDFSFAVGADGTQIIKTRNPDHDHKYLFYVIQRQTKIMGSEGYKRHLKILREQVVPFNQNLPEQKKIASILTSVDEVIENTQKQIDKLLELKKTTMNDLLTKGIGHTEFKDSELGRIPKSWEVKTLDELSDIIDPHPSHRAPPEIDNGVPFLGIGDLDINGDITSSKLRLVSKDEILEHRKRYQITSNSIGFGRVASIGKVIDFQKEQKDILLSPTLAVIEQYGVNKKFLVNFLKSLKIQNQLNYFITGSTRSSLGIQLLRELYILIPPFLEQKKIGQILSSFDSKIESANRKLSKTKFLKKSLMQDLLTGKIRVKV